MQVGDKVHVLRYPGCPRIPYWIKRVQKDGSYIVMNSTGVSQFFDLTEKSLERW